MGKRLRRARTTEVGEEGVTGTGRIGTKIRAAKAKVGEALRAPLVIGTVITMVGNKINRSTNRPPSSTNQVSTQPNGGKGQNWNSNQDSDWNSGGGKGQGQGKGQSQEGGRTCTKGRP